MGSKTHDEQPPTVDQVLPAPAADAHRLTATLAPLTPDSTVPDRLGRYRRTDILGSGGFGVVYKGFDEEQKRYVHIKVPNRH